MHEASLMTDLIQQIEKVAKDSETSRVTKIKVSLGALSHFTEEHFQEHFDVASKGTIAEKAILEMTLLTDIHDPNAQHVTLESIDFESE